MNVELLGEDELLVELEVRGLSDLTRGVATPELKSALAERLRAERVDCLDTPWDQHEAAVERPEQEVAICLQKLHAVQQYLVKGIRTGKTVAEMYPQVATRLIHVRGRIDRSAMCPSFNPQSTSVHIVMQMLWRMVADLGKGVVAAADIAEKLSRVVIKIDRPINEDEVSSCEGVSEEKEIEEEEEVREDEEVVSEQVKQISGLGQVDTKLKEILAENDAKIAQYEMQLKSTIDKEDDQMKVSGRRARNSRGTLQRKVGARVRLKRFSGTRMVARRQPRRPRSSRRVRRIHVWIGRYAMRARILVDLLVGVLDLRLVYEVLAKANRRVACALGFYLHC